MSRNIECVFLNQTAEGLDRIPYPGALGQRIYEAISKQAWQQWLERSVMIINEYQLNSSNPEHVKLLEQHMVGFLFGEGEYGSLPEGFNATG